ncbi:unnamed protein product [Staurois parvus]|uniref:Uncharacterized protein n=1 Tax=Staurois parvus TaxID=386267 RepID=A0ABN9HVZ6_9NEOB|nr:unnamed protein product [Staurois parvus]
MQTASTNICERMCRSQEFSKFKRGTVIGFHVCNKSIKSMKFPTKYSSSITKWKQLGTTTTQPRSGRPRKTTDWG